MFDELNDDSDSTDPNVRGEHALAYLLRNSPVGSLLSSRPESRASRKLEVVAFVGEEVVEVRRSTAPRRSSWDATPSTPPRPA